jgi:glycosyltransferase involved in cell wall biosynthesis
MSLDPDPSIDTSTGAPELSVVIPAYFGARTIAACLESIHRATRNRRAEIIVVDSSGDATGEIVRERFPGVTLICSKTRLSAGGARNRGAALAKGRLIFFTDQDCIVPADWIDRLERHLDDASIDAAGGAVGIRDPSNLSGCALYFLEFLNHFPGTGAPQRNANFLVGCNSAYRADLLRRVQFPDQTLGEDVLFSHLLHTKGAGVLYDPSIEVRHYNRRGWGQFFDYNRKMGQMAAKYHDVMRLWWTRPFFRAPALTFLAPLVILPWIGFNLLHSRWSYFLRYLLLLPMCLLGNLAWAREFRLQVLELRARGTGVLTDTDLDARRSERPR